MATNLPCLCPRTSFWGNPCPSNTIGISLLLHHSPAWPSHGLHWADSHSCLMSWPGISPTPWGAWCLWLGLPWLPSSLPCSLAQAVGQALAFCYSAAQPHVHVVPNSYLSVLSWNMNLTQHMAAFTNFLNKCTQREIYSIFFSWRV